MKPYWGVEV